MPLIFFLKITRIMDKFAVVINNTRVPKRTRVEEATSPSANASRPLSRAMLSPTTYDLNASCSKLATIGIELINGEDFAVAVKFSSRNSGTVSISVAEWRDLSAQMSAITSWFDVEQELSMENDSAHIQTTGRLSVRLTTAYHEKAITLSLKESAEPVKKVSRKLFSPEIIMERKTFDGIKLLSPCINHRILLLLDELQLVREVRDTLIVKICAQLTQATTDDTTVNGYHGLDTKRVLTTGLDTIQVVYGDLDKKRYLIAAELLCIHHEYIFCKVVNRMEKETVSSEPQH